MKIKLTATHIALLQSIARYAVAAQTEGLSLDTGPGGEDADGVESSLRAAESMLMYWVDEDEHEGDEA